MADVELVIKMPEEQYNTIFSTEEGSSVECQQLFCNIYNMPSTICPKNITNGEIVQALFPNIDKAFSNVVDLNLWWNAKYKPVK